jgi:hypothetical protein
MFHISTEIVDSVLAISFIKYGLITVEYREQTLAAAMAYCRLFLQNPLSRAHSSLALTDCWMTRFSQDIVKSF